MLRRDLLLGRRLVLGPRISLYYSINLPIAVYGKFNILNVLLPPGD